MIFICEIMIKIFKVFYSIVHTPVLQLVSMHIFCYHHNYNYLPRFALVYVCKVNNVELMHADGLKIMHSLTSVLCVVVICHYLQRCLLTIAA